MSIFYFRNSLLILCFKEYSKYISKGSHNNIRGGLYEYTPEVLCFLKKYKSSVQKNKQVHDHNTRTNMDLHIKPCNTNLYKKKGVISMGSWFYNKVPMHIKKLEEYKPHKRELKSFLIDHAFYSVEEFLCCWLML